MSDRTNIITVVLEKETRVDDAQRIVESIEMMRGVLTAKANVSDSTEYMATERARRELGQKLIDVVYPKRLEHA